MVQKSNEKFETFEQTPAWKITTGIGSPLKKSLIIHQLPVNNRRSSTTLFGLGSKTKIIDNHTWKK